MSYLSPQSQRFTPWKKPYIYGLLSGLSESDKAIQLGHYASKALLYCSSQQYDGREKPFGCQEDENSFSQLCDPGAFLFFAYDIFICMFPSLLFMYT